MADSPNTTPAFELTRRRLLASAASAAPLMALPAAAVAAAAQQDETPGEVSAQSPDENLLKLCRHFLAVHQKYMGCSADIERLYDAGKPDDKVVVSLEKKAGRYSSIEERLLVRISKIGPTTFSGFGAKMQVLRNASCSVLQTEHPDNDELLLQSIVRDSETFFPQIRHLEEAANG
jgi:hypothetical protein